MITVPTTLVLGAGASYEFGYPLGEALLYEISDNFISSGTTATEHFFASGINITPISFSDFSKIMRFSGQASVDAFVERRPDFAELAKHSIAHAILCHEDVEKPFKQGQNLYKYIYSCMGYSRKKDLFKESNLNIVTFNYDLSLEYFLDTAIMNSFGLKTESEAMCLREQSIKIKHVHGHIAPLWTEKEPLRKYGGEWTGAPDERKYPISTDPSTLRQIAVSGRDIKESAKNIHIPFEDLSKESRQAFEDAFDLLVKARRIIFLGFAYDDRNLRRLLKCEKPEDTPEETLTKGFGGVELYGSCFGKTERERETLNEKFKGVLQLGSTTENALDFLRVAVDLESS